MTFPYKPGAPPRDATADQLSEYLNRELSQIADALEQIHDVDKLYGTPPRPFDGMLRYADGVTWEPDNEHGEGFYGYWDGEWHYLACCDEGGGGGGCCYTTNAEQYSELTVQDQD